MRLYFQSMVGGHRLEFVQCPQPKPCYAAMSLVHFPPRHARMDMDNVENRNRWNDGSLMGSGWLEIRTSTGAGAVVKNSTCHAEQQCCGNDGDQTRQISMCKTGRQSNETLDRSRSLVFLAPRNRWIDFWIGHGLSLLVFHHISQSSKTFSPACSRAAQCNTTLLRKRLWTEVVRWCGSRQTSLH